MIICDDNGDVNEDNNEDDNDGDDNTTTMATIDDDDVDEDGGGYTVGEETRAGNTSGRFTERQPALCTAEREGLFLSSGSFRQTSLTGSAPIVK